MDALFELWQPVIDKYKTNPNIEIEIRFGRKASNHFDTNVGIDSFKKLLLSLELYNGWESKSHETSTIYYFDGSKRVCINEETEEQVGQIKNRLKVVDFSLDGHPFDVRLGISTELPFEYDGEETSTEQKTRERWSFVRKNLSIDLSMVKGNPDDKDCDDDTSYQVELEIIEPAKVSSRNELYNIVNKVFDVLKCI
jgi:hypothetical protein